jgi:hypothetical protein
MGVFMSDMESNAELFGGKELAAVGEKVYAITLDSNVVILAGKESEHRFRIENEFAVENSDNGSHFVVRYDPYNRSNPVRENLTELTSIIDATILHARAYVDGILKLIFSGGTVIMVKPKDKYEAWTYVFENYILSCPPGGFSAP